MDLENMSNNKVVHNNCKICGFCGRELTPKGYDYIYENVSPKFIEYERCDCEGALKYWNIKDFEAEQIEKKKRYRKCIEEIYKTNYIGKRFQDYNFQNLHVTENNRNEVEIAKDYSKKCINNTQENGLIITGELGSGKTHIAAAIANNLIEKGQIVLMSRLNNLLDIIKENFGDNRASREYIELFSSIEMLIIDDLGTEKISSWVLENLYKIVLNRSENKLPFIITTRFNKMELLERFELSNDKELAEAMIEKLYQTCYGIELKNTKEKVSTSY